MIAEIYAFLNRNLLKPLNVQIDEMRDYLAEYILENSSEVYLQTGISYSWTKSVSGDINMDLPEQIKFNSSGDATLTCNFNKNGYDATGTVSIYKNGVLLTTVSLASGLDTVTRNLSGINIDDIISFHVTTSTSYSNSVITLNNINLLATPVYARTLNLIEVTGA